MENKNTIDLGKLKGDLLVFGGVYSNYQALLKMKSIADSLHIPSHNIICTGDVVGYCAQPEKTVQMIMNWNIHTIAGNVEIQLREGEEDCGCDFTEGGRCDVFSRQWYPFAQKKLSKSSINWMEKLPEFISFTYGNKRVCVVHGSYHHTSEFIFKSTPWNIKAQNFKDTQSNLILSGHCGLPFHDAKNDNIWLNPGVIGMPANDGTTRVWYAILKVVKGEVVWEHHSFEYDYETASNNMKQNNLPQSYAKTLCTGIWDNCEILPDAETKLQGVRMEF